MAEAACAAYRLSGNESAYCSAVQTLGFRLQTFSLSNLWQFSSLSLMSESQGYGYSTLTEKFFPCNNITRKLAPLAFLDSVRLMNIPNHPILSLGEIHQNFPGHLAGSRSKIGLRKRLCGPMIPGPFTKGEKAT
jgi:hypothetical protein